MKLVSSPVARILSIEMNDSLKNKKRELFDDDKRHIFATEALASETAHFGAQGMDHFEFPSFIRPHRLNIPRFMLLN